ncbi:MAG: hypothetical protein Q8L55_03235 [Phycisphaerales bacterium]|nr:hypothetical protein [Phycisphaerales bacterium]
MKLTNLQTAAAGLALVLAGGMNFAVASQPPAAAPAAAAEAPAHTPGYTRVVDKDDGSLTLEIAAKSFVPAGGKPGPTIHLVGAVHIADKPFYTELQSMLDAADLVLFEGVKPPGAGAFDATLDEEGKIKATTSRLKFLLSVVEEDRSRSGKLPGSLQQAVDDAGKRWKTMIASSLTDAWGHQIIYTVAELEKGGQRAVVTSVGPNGQDDDGKGDDVRIEGKAAAKKGASKDPGLQAKMADALGLTFQLDAMDSSKPNWRSSDMSVDQMQAAFEAAGVEGNQLFSMLEGSSLTGKLVNMGLGLVKSIPGLADTLKLTMVELLGSPDALAAGPANMKKMMDVILKDRNDVVLKDLRAVIDTEQPARKEVSIFYGAGHLADMEEKLKKDFGYTFAGEQWLPAITVDPKAAGMTPAQSKKMRETMRKQIESQAAAAEKAEKAKQKGDEGAK